MSIRFLDSADKHRVPHQDALYAMTHAVGTEIIPGLPGDETRVFVGHPHPQTDDWIEVMVAKSAGNNFMVFHVMPLTDLYRHLIGGKE